jgi:hypothetical protein
MPQVYTTITINAPPSLVRKVFLAFPQHPEWDPWLTAIESPVESPPPGTRIKFVVLNNTVTPVIVENTPERFSWAGNLLADWIFRGVHCFDFEPFGDVGENGETVNCKFCHYETFSGLLSWLILFFIREKAEQGFTEMNEALKKRVEVIAKMEAGTA